MNMKICNGSNWIYESEWYLLNFYASSSDGESPLDQFVSHSDHQMIVPKLNHV